MKINQGFYIFVDDEYDSADDSATAKKFYADFVKKGFFAGLIMIQKK
jgi:hypothetical protein